VPIILDHSDGSLIIASEHALNHTSYRRLKRDPVADCELEHLGVRADLMQKPKALNDPAIEVDEFSFG
jgi:hypothetical protein